MYKLYNIRPVNRTFPWGDMLVVPLGEKGRGRKETLVPFDASDGSKLVELGVTKTGNPKIVGCSSNNETLPESPAWLAVLSGKGCYTRGTYGTVYFNPVDEDKIKVIARGKGAFGLAGRIGEYNEFLVVIQNNTFVRVRPAGGEQKSPRYWLFFGTETVTKVPENELHLFMDAAAELEPSGITSPPPPNELLDMTVL
jgi:hypothetical protein